MPELENKMLIDFYWDESEYGVPNKSRMLKRHAENYRKEEFDDEEDDYYRFAEDD